MKVSVIGAGMVGSEILGHLLNMDGIREIVLVNRTQDKAYAEILDYSHTLSFTYAKNLNLRVGDYSDTADSDVVVVTSGGQVAKGETRDALVKINGDIIVEIIKELERYTPNAIVIVVTNPVDVVTQIALKNSKFPKERLFSSGTVLDSARFMKILSEHVKVDPKNIFGYVLGEHGSTGFIPWSICNVCGLDIDTFCRLNNIPVIDKEKVLREVLQVGFEIFTRKGNTNHGIAASVYRIIRAIAANEHSVLPVGVYVENYLGINGVVMSLPCVINKNGIEKVLNYSFTFEEMEKFKVSERHIKELVYAYK